MAAGPSASAVGSVASTVNGQYGSVVVNADGSYVYTVDNNNAAVQALRNTSQTLTDLFTYEVIDAGGLTSIATLTVTIQGANDTPHNIAATGLTIAENSANGVVVGNANAQDTDAGDTFTYSLFDSAGGRFTIDANTGQITVASSSLLNYEAATSHQITVRVTDAAGAVFDKQFTVNLTDVDEFDVTIPVDINASLNSIAEITTTGTLVGITAQASDGDATNNGVTYSLDDSAGGRFVINSNTGIVTVGLTGLLNFELTSSHQITVRATGQDGSFATATFTIQLIDVNEDAVGSISDQNAAANVITENAAAGMTVGLTARAVDPDGTDVVVYSLDNNDGGRFAINPLTGVVTLAGTVNRESDGASRSITVRATSTDGSFSTQAFTINIADVDEFDVTTPVDANAAVNSVAENAAIGTTVGITGSAFDIDATSSVVTYSLVNNDGGRFAIDANTGVVTVGGAINRETEGAVRSITVRATSQDGSFADQTLRSILSTWTSSM